MIHRGIGNVQTSVLERMVEAYFRFCHYPLKAIRDRLR